MTLAKLAHYHFCIALIAAALVPHTPCRFDNLRIAIVAAIPIGAPVLKPACLYATITAVVAITDSGNFTDGFATKLNLVELAIDRATNGFRQGFRLRRCASHRNGLGLQLSAARRRPTELNDFRSHDCTAGSDGTGSIAAPGNVSV